MLPKVAIVGRPNVGKSTLFNRIVGERISITDDMPGVTRDRIYAEATWCNKKFKLIDTGGIEISNAPFLTEIKAQAQIAIDEADVICFIVDCRGGLSQEDEAVAKMLYKSKKPVVVGVNKVDNESFLDVIYDFYSLGFDEPIAISSLHGIGVGDLLDKIVSYLPEMEEEKFDDDEIRFCVIGRPNVGKSSLVNAILGTDRSIVSNIEGTTRDSIDTSFTYNDQKYVIVDTAGIKKSGRIYENADKFALIRALDALDRCDIALVMIDASLGIQEQDKHVAGYAKDANKTVVLVVNKWDTVIKDDKTMKRWTEEIRGQFQFLDYAPICFISAKENKRIDTLFPEILKCYISYHTRLNTSLLNDVILDAVAMKVPGLMPQGRAKFYYATQVGIKPPTFVIFVNDPNLVHFSYSRYLENQLRKNFDLDGTPIKLIYRKRE